MNTTIGDPPSEHRRPAAWWEGAFSEILPERGRLSVMEKISYGSIDNGIANRSRCFEPTVYWV